MKRDDPSSSTAIDGGNMVVVASDRPIDPKALQQALDAESTHWTIAAGDDLTRWTGAAEVLTDDHAPVDQLLQPTRPARRWSSTEPTCR